MADTLAALDEMVAQVAALEGLVSAGRGKNIAPAEVQPLARAIAKIYFESIRSHIQLVQNRAGLIDEIDYVVQTMLQLATTSREKRTYIGQISELRPYLMEATIDVMKSSGQETFILSPTEASILKTLSAILPASAASYEQALRDIAGGSRVSWRGTATELREILREVLDHLAPDAQVMGAPGFKLEPERNRPTHKQKVKYILKARRAPGAAATVVAGSLETVDEMVASLARSTYDRGSVSTHTATDGKEIRNLKRYVEAVLAELLEVA